MADLVSGGAIGVPFTILYEVIKEVVVKISMFKPLLDELNSKIDALKPLIDEIDKYNKVLDRREKELRDFKMQMEKGPELIRKCSNLSRWKSYKKYKYSNQLLELQNSLQNLLFILSVQQARDVKENLVATKNVETVAQRVDANVVELKEKGMNLMKETLDEVRNLGTMVQQIDMKGEVQDQIDCEVPEPPLVTVGLDAPLRELKMKLLRDRKVSMLVLTAPGGCGKTTLATKFCQDEEVKVAIIEGKALAVSFWSLCDSIKQVKDQILMFKPQLGDIKSALDSLKPLIKDMTECEKELDGPDEELENLIMEMEEGVELIRKCSKASRFKKYKYGSRLVELSKSLQRLRGILKVQGIREVKKARVSVRNVDNVVQRIEKHCVIQNDQSEGWCAVPDSPRLTVGLDVPLRELKMKLFNDGVSMVVLTAPGGCGKTTLATKLCQDAEVKDKFKSNVFFVTVSKKPNLYLIAQELYHQTGAQVPDFQNEVTANSWLQQFRKQTGQNPILLVLDDVWAGSEFILKKFDELKMSNYKILVTSRSAFPRFGSPYYLQCLNYEDTMALFHHSASLEDSSYIPEDLQRKIIERCKGFPLAITVVGRSLCGQPIEIWQKRVMEWSRDSSVLDSESDLRACLQRSLDALDEEKPLIRECFIDLGLFPEDQRIPATILIDIWAELYGIDKDILSIANLYELASRSLANLVVTRKDNRDGDGYYSEHFVTQHGMLRELAILQMSQEPIQHRMRLMIDICGDNLPTWSTEQIYQPLEALLVSILTDGEFSSKWHNLQLPKAKVLILNFRTKNYTLPEFVEKMDKLKALIITSYGSLPAELNNFQLVDSLPNLKRIRLERISIPSISRYPIQLKSLKKLSLFMCSIGQGFGNGSIHISEAFPNLVEMNIDYCNDLVELPAQLCDLIQLKKLSVTNSHKLSALPEEIGNLVNLELLRLRSCTDLSELPGSIRNLKKLNLLDISDCFSIKELPEDIGEMCSLERLNMRQCARLNQLPLSVMDLEQLKEVTCDEETQSLWEPFLPYLKNIHIKVVKEDINLNWLHKVHC